MNEVFYQKLRNILKENQVLVEEPLAKHTTFQIGGPADYLVLPETFLQVAGVIDCCKETDMPFYVLGNGSNLLVSDKGYRGTVIKLGRNLSNITINERKTEESSGHEEAKCFLVQAQSGVLLSKLASVIAEYGLAGFEFAAGIPGTLGGAVTMNAGAYGGEMKDCISGATLLDQDGNMLQLGKEELTLGYRKSIIQDRNYIVLDASFTLWQGDKEEIRNRITELNARRREKQPLEYPSAGSTFKRPEGYFAGKLIMDSGLRGYRVGNAQVSEKHCGFVINRGGATAEEVRTLISEVRQIVYHKFGVMLEPEIRFLGDF